ncbi:CapA family protein [Clostridium sp.]|uniref:CapA family protein n=1 Tax=Clostridium sp. TaxID=1506 RepID=UPI002FC9F290
MKKKKSRRSQKKKSNKLKNYILLLISIVIIGIAIYSVTVLLNKTPNITSHYNENTNSDNSKIFSITSVGNIIVHDAQIAGAKTTDGKYNFDKSFEYVKKYITDSNLSIGVFEGNFNGGKYEGYPTFNTPDEFLNSLKKTGFDVINYSSNHIIDKGASGVRNTTTKSTNSGLINLGVKNTDTDKDYIIYNLDGHKVGLFAYTYKTGENSINSLPIPKEVKPLINTFSYDNLDKLYSSVSNSIQEMKSDGVEFIIGSFHWGDEYKTKENKFQKEIAKNMNNLGVDIILGSHPHVIQPYEILTNSKGKSTFVAYSQGNFLSNQCYEEIKNYLSEDGLMLNFKLGLKDNKLYLKNYSIIPTWTYREKRKDNLYTHRVVPLEDVQNNKNPYNLPEDAYNRAIRSLNDTKKIIGEDALGEKTFP